MVNIEEQYREEAEFDEDIELKYTCQDCGEVRYDEDGEPSARVHAGMKCGACAYGY